MLDPEEIRWVKSAANELNNLLQVITESSQFLEKLCQESVESRRYADIIRNGVERAAKVTEIMLERVGQYEQTSLRPPGINIGTTPLKPGMTNENPAPVSELGERMDDVKIWNPEGTKELILIVDDEDFVTVLAQRVLADQGYRVIIAKDGFQCLNIYKSYRDKIDLVILDFTMPIMDGSEVFNELRAINPEVPVVLSSGFTEQDKLRWMLANGLRGFIPKPYTQEKLLAQVRSALDALKTDPPA